MNTNFHRSGCGSTLQLASNSSNSTNASLSHNCGDDVNTADEQGNAPLHDAIIKDDIQKCQDLLKHPNIDVNYKNLLGETPLCLGLQRCRYDTSIITQLLEAGCDLNLLSGDGEAPLHIAMRQTRTDLAHQLLQKGADVNCISNYGETPLLLSLRYEDSELFKLIWPKVDCNILLGCREPFFYTYLQRTRFPLPEFLECLHLLLDSPKAYQLLGELIALSSFYELINCFYDFSIEANERLALINICLSLGFKANISDINHVFQLYGFGDELEAFIYSFNNDVTRIPVNFASPLLDLILPIEEYSEINCLRVNRDILHTFIGTRKTFNAFKYFSMSSKQRKSWSYLSDVSAMREYEIHQKILAAPEFPSLLELSRNKVYNFIRSTNEFMQPYQFHNFVKSLRVPRCIQDILRFKRPIYE